jgi:HSP20 family protein
MNEKTCCRSQESDVASAKEFFPAVDVVLDETSGRYRIVVDVPGVDEHDIEVKTHKGELEISAGARASEFDGELLLCEVSLRSYRRKFRLAEDIDVDKICAHVEAGVLTVELPRVVAAQPKKIEIRGAH